MNSLMFVILQLCIRVVVFNPGPGDPPLYTFNMSLIVR